MYLKSIHVKKDIVFDYGRESQKKFFKIRSKTHTVDDRRKPIFDKNKRWGRTSYEKKKVIDRFFTIFKKDFTLNFNSKITIIVGDNGCGKSAFFKSLKQRDTDVWDLYDDEQKKSSIKEWIDGDEYKLSFIHQPNYIIVENEIHKNAFIDEKKKSKVTLSGQEVAHLWSMMESSNGENTLDFISGLVGIENSLIVLDEPETSLSIKSQFHIKDILLNLSKNNQLIIITHSPILMGLCNEVYDFEKKELIETQKYIKNQSK